MLKPNQKSKSSKKSQVEKMFDSISFEYDLLNGIMTFNSHKRWKKNILNIGIPSKGRLRKDVLNIFKKNKLNLISERGERDLLGSIKQKKNVKILYLHAREII